MIERGAIERGIGGNLSLLTSHPFHEGRDLHPDAGMSGTGGHAVAPQFGHGLAIMFDVGKMIDRNREVGESGRKASHIGGQFRPTIHIENEVMLRHAGQVVNE